LKPISDNQFDPEENTRDNFISKIINNTKNPKKTVTKVLEDIPKENPQ